MKNMIKITEDQALGEGKDFQTLLLEKYMEGYVVYHADTHPAVGEVVTLVTVEYFAEKLAFAIRVRDVTVDAAVAAHESAQEDGGESYAMAP